MKTFLASKLYNVKDYRRRYYLNNREKLKELSRKYQEEHKEQRREYKKKYYQEHKEQIKERQKKYNEEPRGRERSRKYRLEHKTEARGALRKWLDNHREQSAQYKREREHKIRLECLSHYSNGKMICECCGESHIEFLAIDHIGGGGVQHRKLNGYGKIGSWLKARKFPPGYRVLCHNCNLSRGIYGYCPHEKEKK